MLIHNSKAYINQVIQFRIIYHSTNNSIHSLFKFPQTIHSFHQKIYSGRLISPLFNKATQTKKSTFLQKKNGHKFLQLIFHFCLLVQGIQLKRKKNERKHGKSFSFSIILRERILIHGFKLVTSRGGREFKDLVWWSSSLATFLFV